MKELVEKQNFNNHDIAITLHDTKSKNIVIFCHGYRGSNIGPNRFFVRAARQLAKNDISSLRFDQYCSGNSDGDFFNSSFNDWIKTTKALAQYYLKQNYKVSLLGQSMGASAAIAVASELPEITAVVAWTPDPNIDLRNFIPQENGVVEENGQIVQEKFWQEASNAKIEEKLQFVKPPTYIIQCTADEYVDQQNREAIIKNAQSNHTVENLEGYSHNPWTYQQSIEIINKSIDFLIKNFTSTLY